VAAPSSPVQSRVRTSDSSCMQHWPCLSAAWGWTERKRREG